MRLCTSFEPCPLSVPETTLTRKVILSGLLVSMNSPYVTSEPTAVSRLPSVTADGRWLTAASECHRSRTASRDLRAQLWHPRRASTCCPTRTARCRCRQSQDSCSPSRPGPFSLYERG